MHIVDSINAIVYIIQDDRLHKNRRNDIKKPLTSDIIIYTFLRVDREISCKERDFDVIVEKVLVSYIVVLVLRTTSTSIIIVIVEKRTIKGDLSLIVLISIKGDEVVRRNW